jgi:hypothetical protein
MKLFKKNKLIKYDNLEAQNKNYFNGCCKSAAISSTESADAIIDKPGRLTVHC